MKRLFAILAIVMLAVTGPPAFAHGGKTHEQAEEAAPVSPTAAAEGRAVMQGEASVPVVPTDAEADEHEGSVWTKLHPAMVHFPIALLLMAALTEFVGLFRRAPGLQSAVSIMAWGGAVGAVVAAIFGWIHTGLWLGGDTTMQLHRWTGTSLAFAAPIAAIFAGRPSRTAFRVLIAIIAVALLAQGFWGGELAHGPNHLGL